MSNNISDKKSLCQVFELSDLHSIIEENSQLAGIKIISIGCFTLLDRDIKSLLNKGKRIQATETTYEPSAENKVKLEAILKAYGLSNPENAYLIATKGKGSINPSLQNNQTAFKNAQLTSSRINELINADSVKYAVFVDDDAKPDILGVIGTSPAPTSIVLAESEDILNATQQIEDIMVSNPLYRFEVLSKTKEQSLFI